MAGRGQIQIACGRYATPSRGILQSRFQIGVVGFVRRRRWNLSRCRPVLDLEAPGKFKPFRFKLFARVAGAVFEHRIDGFPSNVPDGLAVPRQCAARRGGGNAAQHTGISQDAHRARAAAETEKKDPVAVPVMVDDES
jgi:hypothetical protein